MPEQTLKDIDDELDDLSIKMLELMNENISTKMAIERAVRSGCMDLAKTRYILGNTNSVSALQIPTEDLTATTTVSAMCDDLAFELHRENGDSKKGTNQDPLRWFGVLVPSNLRQGQSWFIKALDLSVQSANVSVSLNNTVDKFNKLMGEKNALKSKTEE